MKKVILGTSFIALMAFGGTAFAASPTESTTTISQVECMAMTMKDCAKMIKDCIDKGMSVKDCMKMMKDMQQQTM